MPATIEQRIESYKSDLLSLTPERVLRKHIVFGECYWLDHDLYYELKQDVATHFGIHPSEVVLVGSGKLGFSIAEKTITDPKNGNIVEIKPRYREFGDDSDLDVAILSPRLFDTIWYKVYQYKKTKPIWPNEAQFKKYLFEGWIRPDKLPPSTSGLEIQQDWFEFFTEITNTGKYGDFAITAGLYKNWDFLESYQSKAISGCIDELGTSK